VLAKHDARYLCLLQVWVMRNELRDPDTVLAGFVPSIEGNHPSQIL
jgi:hypothetical protein